MGGAITVDSAPGAGSTFTCTLRVGVADPAAGAPQAGPQAEITPARRLRVLVAEDNPVNQRLIRAILERDRHAVTLVDSGQAAVDTLHGTEPFDLVLMDIQMPGMDGFQATAAIRALASRRGLPIVALTAHAQVGYDNVCTRAGMNGHLTKPIDRAALRRLLLRVAANEPIDGLTAA